MTPREIIARSWAITKNEPMLRKWGFVSTFLETLLNVKLFIYQTWFFYSFFIKKDPIGLFTIEEKLMAVMPRWAFITLVISFITLISVELLFPHFARGAIIGLAAKSHRKEKAKGGLVLAVYNFFPLFAIHELLVLSGITTTITLISLSLRYGGAAAMVGIFIIITTYVCTNILEFFWIFAEEAVVVRKAGVREATSRSFKLVISYLGQVVFLMLLLFFIILRILANVLMVILIPGIVMGLGILLSFVLPPIISYTLAVILGFLIIVLASYFFAYLEVFRQTVWTITYIELSRKKDLDLIEKKSE